MPQNQSRRRVVVGTRRPKTVKGYSYRTQPRESVVALAMIAAAALATFAALLMTSRPYDPMNSTIAPQEVVPPAPIPLQPSPKPSPTQAPSPQERITPSPQESTGALGEDRQPDDAIIKNEIEKHFASDAALANLDVNAIVENGSVTLAGAIQSSELKQRVERTVRSIKGVTAINNQLVVIQATPE